MRTYPGAMSRRDVVVVGASAGGVRVLCALVAALPPDLPAAVVVVVHVPATGSQVLASILDRAGPLPARVALDGELLGGGAVLLAPPDRDVMVAGSASGPVVSLSPAATSRGAHRPRADALLLSAAAALGPRVLAVVLSGDGEDGALGLAAVLAAGGAGVVQDPGDAAHPSMPRAALAAAGEGLPSVVLAPAGGLGAAVTAAVVGAARAPSWARAS